MDKFLDLLIGFAKDNGVGVTVPIAIWIVLKAVIEDYKAKKDAGEKNHDDIHALEVRLATAEEAIENIKKSVY